VETRVAGRAVVYGAVALSLAGCATARSALSGAVGGANRGVSEAAGNAAANAVAAHFRGPSVPGAPAGGVGTAQMMTYYANWMFALGFNSGGYWLPNADLQPGQSVTFEFTSNDSRQRMECAYLTQESLDAATVGTESVTTPAGTFSARHIRYTMMGGGTYEWWAADVPGGVVKYVVGYGGDNYTQTLVAMSSNAATELGSYWSSG
jgi:hypothetical protein